MSRQRRYPSDLTDEQWALIEPLLPAPRTGGRPEKHPRRSIVDGILYVLRTGCACRYLPVPAGTCRYLPVPAGTCRLTSRRGRPAMIRWAAITTMTSRIARGEPPHGNNAGTGPTSHDRASTTRYEERPVSPRETIDKKLFYVKNIFRNEGRRLP